MLAPIIEPIIEQVKEEIVEATVTKIKTKGIDMPITKKTLEQVQCSSCKKYMSEKNLRYSHPKYCLERYTIETPTEIPIPNIKVNNDEGIKNKIVLPVKNIKLKRSKTVVIEQQPTIEYEPSVGKPRTDFKRT